MAPSLNNGKSEAANVIISASRIFVRLGFIVVFFLAGCGHSKGQALKEYYEIRPYFGTTVTIHCFYNAKIDISKVVRECWKKADQIQLNMNVYADTKDGDLIRLNESGVEGVHVSDDVYTVLKHSIAYSLLTGGAYDVTIFPLVKLWKNAARQGRLPDKDLLESAKDKVGFKNLRLQEPNLVFFMKKGMMVDLGSPASAYFCDEVARILDANNIEHFLVDGGGEIFCRGKDKGTHPWRIGIQNPFNKAELLTFIELKDKGISTSGRYERFNTIGTRRFSHIINPQTGYPQKDAVSASVIADTTETANALSTALCVMGGKKGVQLARSLKNVEALVIENINDTITPYQTDGFR